MGFLSSLFGFDDAKPAQSQVIQSATIPTELKPYVTEIMESAQTQFKDNMASGYVPYTGKTTADLTPEEVQAMERVSGLAGVVDPYISEAEDIYRTGAREFTGEEAQRLMSPYQQAVTDIELRKAQENFEGNVMPKFEAQAISQGGGPGGLGTRAGIESAELQRGQTQLLADIQAQGSNKAYQDAKGIFGDQLNRERQMAGDLGRTGSALFQSGLAEAGAIEGVGSTKRGIAQNLLDESLYKFKEEEAYPQSQLAQYSGTIYGNPVLGTPNFNRSTSGTPYQPSTGQNLLGLGLTGLNMYGMAGGFGMPTPGKFNPANIYSQPPRRAASGGKVGGGLAGLPVVNRNMSGQTDPDQYGKTDMNQFRRGRNEPLIGQDSLISSSKELRSQTPSQAMSAFGNSDLNINVVTQREEKANNLQKDLRTKSNAELDVLDQAYFAGREANIQANPMARAAAMQRLIAAIMTNEGGALAGAAKAAPKVLEELGQLDQKLIDKRSKLADDKFKTKREKIKERKTEGLDIIKGDTELSRVYDGLPAKLKQRYLNEFKIIKTLEISELDKELKLKSALAKLKNDDKNYILKLRKLEEVDLANVSISQAKVIKEFMDQYDTNKEAAIAALNKAKIDPATIREIMVGVLSKRVTGSGSSLAGTGGVNRASKDQIVKDVNELLQRLTK